MRTRSLFTGAFVAIALVIAGCSQESSGPTQPEPAASPAPAPEPATPAPAPLPPEEPAEDASQPGTETVAADSGPAPAVTPAPTPAAAAPVVTPTTKPAAAPAPAPAPLPTAAKPLAVAPAAQAAAPAPLPAPTAQPPAPPAAAAATARPTADVDDPGGVIEVGATKAGLTRIGSEECGDCHDVQFTSWAEGPHAARKPPLDCEGCHGPGSEYKPKAIMKDPEKARAAGLVVPDKTFCGKCHKRGVNDDLMKKVHAHEE